MDGEAPMQADKLFSRIRTSGGRAEGARAEGARPIRVRKIDLPFGEAEVPRFWLHGNASLTHFANGLNLLFPPGERFFIRSVKHYLDDLEDPALRDRVKGFFGQEGRHGHEHDRANRVLEGHGYDIARFLRIYERVAFDGIEQVFPPVMRLSVTVACEHYTATLAKGALTDGFLDGAHPIMAKLLRWHAAEEIEHKSVAFDVLRQVDPRHSVRVLGLVIATTQLLGWWLVAAHMLSAQEDLSPAEWRASRREARRLQGARDGGGVGPRLGRAILDYLRPDFHPDDVDDYELARAYLASLDPAVH